MEFGKNKDYSKDFILFGIKPSDLKEYTNAEDFANSFQKCSAPIESKNIKITNELVYLKDKEDYNA